MRPRLENAYVLNVMADDRPGIVSAVSRAVADAGGNIDACSQTVLSGYFTLIMIVSFPVPVAEKEFLETLTHPTGAAAAFRSSSGLSAPKPMRRSSPTRTISWSPASARTPPA